MIKERIELVAYCGLNCGGCGSYKRGRCKGCLAGGGFSSCKVRQCCLERNYRTCAGCPEYLECRKLNSFIAKVYSLIFRSNRRANLDSIKKMGIEKWVEEVVLASNK